MTADIGPFTPIPHSLAQQVGLVCAAVYGEVRRRCNMQKGICDASLETLGTPINLDRATVMRSIKKLCELDYLIDQTPGRRNAPHSYTLSKSVAECNSNTVVMRNSSKESVAEGNKSVAHNNSSIESVAESQLNREDSSTTTKEGMNQIGDLCKEHFSDPAIEPYRTQLLETVSKYSADKVLWAIQTALSPDRQNGKAKSWGYVLGILEKDERRSGNQQALASRPRSKSPPAQVSEEIQRLREQDKMEIHNPLDRS